MEEEMYGEDYPCTCDPCDCDCGPGEKKYSETTGEGNDQVCTCDPCECDTPPGSPVKTMSVTEADNAEGTEAEEEDQNLFQLDEFARAKAYFMKTSTKSGLSLYDHLSEVIRKLLDERAPKNPVDYIEEISMNVKRYRFQPPKDVLQDVFYISEPVLNDARTLTENWKQYSQWADDNKEIPGEGFVAGSFLNLLRMQYYIEQVNIGLPREEMFRISLAIKDLTGNKPYITKARFWGKIFCLRKNYYVIEADVNSGGGAEGDLWDATAENEVKFAIPEGTKEEDKEKIPGAQETFEKAGKVVLNPEVLEAYSKTSGLPPDKQANLLPKPKMISGSGSADPGPGPAPAGEDEWAGEGGPPVDAVPFQPEMLDAEAAADYAKWQTYQEELMTKFPVPPKEKEEIEIPPEAMGQGCNRRAFYVCNNLGEKWILLPACTPKQINVSRRIRWGLTGELESSVIGIPNFPGKEGHFLKCLLTRASAGALVSPKGFYRSNSYPNEMGGESDVDDLEDEEDANNSPGDDTVTAVKKFRAPMGNLTNPELSYWVHHACALLPQGRNVWWNPSRKGKGDEEDEDSEDEEFEGEEGEGGATREVGPPLFRPIGQDTADDGRSAWTLISSSSVFKEYQVVAVRSNNWPGMHAICTIKGKVDNIYLGDGQKFAYRSFSPYVPVPIMKEYKCGPEMEEFPDPTAEEEQKFLSKLEDEQIKDAQPAYDGDEEEEEFEGELDYSDND